MAIRQTPQSFSLTTPKKNRVCHPAICNRYPASPRKNIALATGHGNEGAIRANAGNKRNYNLHDRFGRSPVFEGKKTGEKGRTSSGTSVHLLWERETRTNINVLDIVSEGGHDGMSKDRRECDALAQVKARGEDGRANHEAAPMKLNRDN